MRARTVEEAEVHSVIPRELYRRLKARAATQGKPIYELLGEAVAQYLGAAAETDSTT